MAEEPSTKQRKIVTGCCILCGEQSRLDELSKPQDFPSWQRLHEAAKIRHFDAILTLWESNTDTIPNLLYHKRCREDFTHKKGLEKIQKNIATSSVQGDNPQRQPVRQQGSYTSRVYDKVCIFCEKQTKYLKKTRTREPLVQALDLRADKTVRDIATAKSDTRILAITSRDIVAAEAHYHVSCYKQYTCASKPHALNLIATEASDDYQQAEKKALKRLYDYIHANIFSTPHIVSLLDLTLKLVSLLDELGVAVKESTKKHLRRNLELEFGDTLHFFPVGRRVYIRPHNLSTDSIACDYVNLKDKLEVFTQGQQCEQLIERVALILRGNIKNGVMDQVWPPKPEELTETYVELPGCLLLFLKVLLGGKQAMNSDRIGRLSWSLAQDVVAAVTNAQVLTPKHILLPWVIKTLTGNVEIIRTLNRLGHSCSYTRLEEIDTALCIEKMNSGNETLPAFPAGIHPGIPTVLAFDNIDRQEETLSGAGTSHRINGIIVQPTSLTCAPPRQVDRVDKKDRRRTVEPTELMLPAYISSGRELPPPVKTANLSQPIIDAVTRAKYHNLIWIITRLSNHLQQNVASWTGFNIQTRDHVTVSADVVGYLPTINAPATALSTVQEILRQSEATRQSLQLEKIAVVMDQALYAKATEVAWKHKLEFDNIILMMGNFHIICNLLSIIGKMFGYAGLRDLAVESGVIAEGSIDKVLEGKQYNRGVRLHKLTYEALMRLAWESFTEWLDTNYNRDLEHLNEVIRLVADLQDDMRGATFESTLNNGSVQRILDLFAVFLERQHCENGQLAAYWMLYIDLVEILLGLIRADRTGDWQLHLGSIRALIPWCFAMDKTNYARYLPVYHAQMSELDRTSPDLHQHFLDGGFSVQLRQSNPFGRIAVDQTLEETVNKDTQTSGGTKGFSLHQGALSRYYLTAEHRANALRQLRGLISLQSPGLGHADLLSSRIARDEADVKSIVELLESSWINPFDIEPCDLVCLSTGVAAPADVCNDLLKARVKGEEAYKLQSERLERGSGFYDPIKKLKLKTFADMKKVTVIKGTNKEIILKADNRVFGHMLLIAQNRKLDMQEVLCYPLGQKPWALANADGTLKKTGKSSLGKHIEKEMATTDTVSGRRATIVDAMGIVQKVHGEQLTFDELSDRILKQILTDGRGSERIDVVFDMYRDQSIKTAERINRGSSQGIVFHEIKSGHRIKNYKRLLTSTESKAKLTKFLADSWKNEKNRELLGNTTLLVTSEEQCFQITQKEVKEVEELATTGHEEADTRLAIHAKHAAANHPTVIVISEDTDVFVILLGIHCQIGEQILLRRGKINQIRLIDITKLGTVLGKEICEALVGVHAWTGCDSVSSFAGKGKVKAFNMIRNNVQFRDTFVLLGQQWSVSDELFDAIQRFTCSMYCRNTKAKGVNELRYDMFCAKNGDVSSGQLPPCEDALLQHTKRANYQAAIWRRSLQNMLDLPDPYKGHGWHLSDGSIAIQWLTVAPAPDVVLSLMACKCPRVCVGDSCICIMNGLPCTPACKLQNCTNMTDEDDTDPVQEIDDSDIDSD